MATLAPPPQTTDMQPREGADSPSKDPFWQSTPRSTPGLTSLMTAVQQVAPPPPQRNSKAVTARRPQCTHMSMTRQYGGHASCNMCGKVPSLGWLYTCQQDQEQTDRVADPDVFPVVPNESSYLDVQARLAESLGMSSSVVTGIRSGDYTFEQVDRLIEQKKHLLATIRRTESGGSSSSTPQRPSRFGEIIASVGAVTTLADLTSTPSKLGDKAQKQTTCAFQVCHACRPFFADRQYMSFEKVFSGTVPALTEDDMARLPILHPGIVRNMGARRAMQSPAARSGSIDIAMQRDGLDEEDTSDWTPTSATASEAESEVMERDPYPCPGAGMCPLFTPDSGCAYDTGFDDGFRALNHGFGPEPDLSRIIPENSLSKLQQLRGSLHDTPVGASSTASSISLPTPSTAPLVPLTPVAVPFDEELSRRLGKSGKAVSMLEVLPSDRRRASTRLGLGLHGNDSSSSFGSAVEVEGGVALTEEAVETGSPDILTDGE